MRPSARGGAFVPERGGGNDGSSACDPAIGAQDIGILTSGGDCAGLNAVIRAVGRARHPGLWLARPRHPPGHMGLLRRPVEYDDSISSVATAQCPAPRRHHPRHHQQGRSLRLSDARRQPAGPLGGGHRGRPPARPRRADRHRRRRQLRHPAPPRAAGRHRSSASPRPSTTTSAPPRTRSATTPRSMVATEALDRLQPTAASHDRVMILEVMGRDAGHIALAAGIAGGADVILMPEIPYRIEAVAAHIDKLRRQGRNFALVVVAEAVRDRTGQRGAARTRRRQRHLWRHRPYPGRRAIARLTGAETRVTVLGHVQRGGQPTWDDRLLASAFGVHAVDLVAAGPVRPHGGLAEPPRGRRAARRGDRCGRRRSIRTGRWCAPPGRWGSAWAMAEARRILAFLAGALCEPGSGAGLPGAAGPPRLGRYLGALSAAGWAPAAAAASMPTPSLPSMP